MHTRCLLRLSAVLMLGAGLAGKALAGTPPEREDRVTTLDGLQTEHAGKDDDSLGIEFASSDNRFLINPWLRGQFRYSNPFDNDPLRYSDFDEEPGGELEVRRARLKIEGHVFSEDIGFYFEHELSGDHPLLDLRLDLDLGHDVLMRIGQYKVVYNRERVDSSGQQTFVERSISTYAFTLDRQRGIGIARRWAKGTPAANMLVLGAYEGEGRESGQKSEQALWMARWQWEFLGDNLQFSQSDLKFRTEPAATLAIAASSVRGPYTRFSSSGGGQLDGFTQGRDDRYTLRQGLQEFAWHYAGMSIQQELHIKKIIDHETSQRSTLTGGYAQFGKAWPIELFGEQRAWELALRVARVDWDTPFPDRVQDELSGVANLFLSGHDNKFSAEISRIALDEEFAPARHDIRLQLQWDVSF